MRIIERIFYRNACYWHKDKFKNPDELTKIKDWICSNCKTTKWVVEDVKY